MPEEQQYNTKTTKTATRKVLRKKLFFVLFADEFTKKMKMKRIKWHEKAECIKWMESVGRKSLARTSTNTEIY